MRRFTFFLLAASAACLAVAAPPTPSAKAQIPGWRYCSSAPSGGGSVYFSQVFASDSSVYHVGVSNSFNNFLAARYDRNAGSGALCAGLYDSYQEAADKLNDDAAQYRRAGRDVVFTRWSYSGD